MSLGKIGTYRFDGEITLLLRQTTCFDVGRVTDILASKLKNVVSICVLYCIINCFLHSQTKELQQSVEQLYGTGGIREVYFIHLLHTFFSTEEALGEDFKYTWVILNPNYPIHFI